MAITAIRQPEVFELYFEARSEDKNGLARILLYGELDIATAPLIEHEYDRVEQRGSRVAALDLAGLTFMDVAGLRAILAAGARAKKAGRALALVGAGEAVRRVFYLTGNGGLLDTAPTLVVLNGDGRG